MLRVPQHDKVRSALVIRSWSLVICWFIGTWSLGLGHCGLVTAPLAAPRHGHSRPSVVTRITSVYSSRHVHQRRNPPPRRIGQRSRPPPVAQERRRPRRRG